MSVTSTADGRVVHFPKDADRFSFDAEVSAIFPDMARRSIPLFYETHDLHARLCKPWMDGEGPVSVLDVGASRGAFLKALAHHNPAAASPSAQVEAWDISADMCDHLRRDFPWVTVHHLDASDPAVRLGTYDIINCTYVLQFIRPERQVSTLMRLVKALNPGGVLFLGQKMSVFGPAGRLLHAEYIQFRIDQGYTREEIEAKTKALAGSMNTMPDDVLRSYLHKSGLVTNETSRWTVFNNYMCTKGL